jgi:hypothetical protein
MSWCDRSRLWLLNVHFFVCGWFINDHPNNIVIGQGVLRLVCAFGWLAVKQSLADATVLYWPRLDHSFLAQYASAVIDHWTKEKEINIALLLHDLFDFRHAAHKKRSRAGRPRMEDRSCRVCPLACASHCQHERSPPFVFGQTPPIDLVLARLKEQRRNIRAQMDDARSARCSQPPQNDLAPRQQIHRLALADSQSTKSLD